MQRVVMEVIDAAGAAREWGAGPCMPDAVHARTRRMVNELKVISGCAEARPVEDFLAGG